MRPISRFALVIALSLLTEAAYAAEPSPWFGSDDQAPFQLDPISMVAVTFAGDPLLTGATDKAPCKPAGCLPVSETAKDIPTEPSVPQN